MWKRMILLVALATPVFTLGACQKTDGILDAAVGDANSFQEYVSLMRPVFNAPPPGPLNTVDFLGKTLTLWPYTSNDFSGAPADPINLIFVGHNDPRKIRAALMGLSGDRTAMGFPPVAPFNAEWKDAIGDVQSGYGDSRWTGGVIQLACGEYGPVRFHLRLFTMGNWTVANAHFEVLIPGTADHQVVSWEIAEQFVIANFMRSGLLDQTVPLMPTGAINEAPFRAIPAIIYNGIPEELKALIGGPAGNVTQDVPIGTDGHATILNIAQDVSIHSGEDVQKFTIEYGQVVPKPFCNSGNEYVYVSGPVELEQITTVSDDFSYSVTFHAGGNLTVTPVNPMTGEPIGSPLQAIVGERHQGEFSGAYFHVAGFKSQSIIPPTAPGAGSLRTGIMIRSNGHNAYQFDTRCSSSGISGR